MYLINGGSVYVGYLLDNTDNQTLSLPNPTTLTISNGNSVTLSAGMADLDADPTNELQALGYSNDTLYLSQGNFVVLPHNFDNDTTNELQNINLSNDTLSISNGNSVTIDADTTNEIQYLSIHNDTLSISKANSIKMELEYLVLVGTIIPFWGSNTPQGWLICNGDTVNRNTYIKLFLITGTSWGAGNGTTTFNLPDLRGQFLRGIDGTANVDPDKDLRTAKYSGGNVGNNVGSYQTDELTSHQHQINLPFISGQVGGSTAYRKSGGGSSTNPFTSTTGGNETRPKNAYVNFIIKY